MRPCQRYTQKGTSYKFDSRISEKCTEYFSSNCPCDLAFNNAELDRLLSQYEKLGDQIYAAKVKALESEARASCLAKQQRLIRSRLRTIEKQEEKNIEELELLEKELGIEGFLVPGKDSIPVEASGSQSIVDPEFSRLLAEYEATQQFA